jgi:hypothetical protein
MAWTGVELASELRRYERACRTSGLAETSIESYVAYARRFLSWREGTYRPRGATSPPRRQTIGAVGIADLDRELAEYEQDLVLAGRQPMAVRTYVLNARQFVRWLAGEFIPGATLDGLRPSPIDAGPDPHVARFEHDDDGYLRWLSANPLGYVLNTHLRPTPDYLILHRAGCASINRPLAGGQRWTTAYGKTCAIDTAALSAWARTSVGAEPTPCGMCHPAVNAGVGAGSRLIRRSSGPRSARVGKPPVRFDGDPISVSIALPGTTTQPFAIEGAQWLAETFFSLDPSATGSGSYDSWIAATQTDPDRYNRITDGDVTAVNTTMAARTSHASWAPIIASQDWRWLEAIDPEWDLIEDADNEHVRLTVAPRLHTAFEKVRRPGINVAVATKVLHIKRPRLIPVLDSLVLAQVGSRVSSDPASWVTAVERVRDVGRANVDQLIRIRDHLAERGIEGRSLVRILDALLWLSHPAAGLSQALASWERVLRPRLDLPGRDT